MDEGTYNNIYRNASPITPSTPSNAFQTNVNRSKTRKWVEAKKQTYDGDDWGNDFDDDAEDPEEEEQQAPAPLRTAGLRPIGQGVQPPTHQSSGNRSVSQPTAAFGHIRGQSFGRNPSGPPSLQVQTQQPTPPQRFEPIDTFPSYDAASSGGPARYGSPGAVISPQPGKRRSFVPEPENLGRREYSPASQDRGSPAPASAGPAQRFPPRKSSMGQQDAPTHSDATGTRSGSRPGSSGRPWMDQRSNSPGRPAPASVGTPNKPLPFIRPADIYRRMEEEKEKERRSMDSARRPSIDSAPGTGSDRSSSPANVVRPLVDQRRRTSLDRDESVDSSRGIKPTLAPVAERRSEYGLDRLVKETVSPPPSNTASETITRTQDASTSAPMAAPVPQFSFDRPMESPEDRRKSISPRLPDLARLSGFGADFFSGSSDFSSTEGTPATVSYEAKPSTSAPRTEQQFGGQTMRGLPETAAQSKRIEPESSETTPTKQTGPDNSDGIHRASSLIAGPAFAEEKDITLQLPQHSHASNEDTITQRPRPSRPSIPGGWVSETTNLDSKAPTPMERPEATASQLSPVQDISEASPVTDMEADDLAPTTTVKQAPSIADGSVELAMTKIAREENNGSFGKTTGEHDQVIANEVVAAGPGFHPTPHALPPLQTPDPLAASNPPPIANPVPQTSDISSPPNGDSPSKYSPSTQPLTATTSSGFTPTAPLNTKRTIASPSEFTAPGFLPRNLTMSSLETASPNESDKLREDIINSLSPVNPASVFPVPSEAQRSIPTSPDLTRESRYLSGVYDDYMGFNEDKTLPETARGYKDPVVDELAEASVDTSPAQTVVPSDQATKMTEQNHAQENAAPPPNLQRRFSWEGGSEQVLSPIDQAQSQTSENGAVGGRAHSPIVAVGPEIPDSAPAPTPVLQVKPDSGSTVSHQVSVVSSHAPAGLGVSGIEPPSPVSVLSSERSPGVGEARGRRLSLAEEKVLIQSYSNPVSPSPPQGEHPALATTPPESSPVQEVENSVAPPRKSTNITGWRDILSLPSPAMRIQKLDETRTQYLSMDSGLSNWLEHMSARPQQGAQPGSPSDLPAPAATGHVPGQPSPTGASATAQQPYYQQYLNASNPNLVATSAGQARQSTGNLLSSGQPQTSGFGNSKTQVGVKSKEFLQAASVFGNKATKAGVKSGLKLFNKGKDRLRGNGDKDLEEPQLRPKLSSLPVTTSQTGKSRNDRRSSWGFSVVGSRLQGRPGTAIHSNRHGHSSSFSLLQHLIQRDPRPPSTNTPTPPTPATTPAAIAPRLASSAQRPPSAHLHARGCSEGNTSTSAAAAASVSVPDPAIAAPYGFSLSNLTLPQLRLPRSSSPFRRPSPSPRSRPSSWLATTRERTLIPHSRRNSSSFEVPPAPRSPPRPGLVSPVSAASSPPACQKINPRPDGELQLSKPAPISKNQPTWDPYTTTPLAEEDDDFDFEPLAKGHLSVSLLPTVTISNSRDAVHLKTDNRLDDWAEISRQHLASTSISETPNDPLRSMTAPLTASRPVASPLPYSQPEGRPGEAPRVNSFIGLPPIRRTSTFGLLGGKREQGDEGEYTNSPTAASEEDGRGRGDQVASPLSAMDFPAGNGYHGPVQSGYGYGQAPPQQSQGYPPSAAQFPQQESLASGQNGHGFYTQQDADEFSPGRSPGLNGVAKSPGFSVTHQAHQPVVNSPGSVPRGPLSQFSGSDQPGSSSTNEQPPTQPASRLGMSSPPPAPVGGNPIHRFPPQGQWKLEESHLSEPLNTSRKTQGSPPAQQPGYYAEDKELGSQAPGGPSQPPQRTTRNNGLPPVSAQRFPGLFPAGSSNQSPAQDQIQIGTAAQQAQQQRRDSMGAPRASTQDFDDSRRQSSGLLNQIGGKFLPHRGRSDSMLKDEPTVQADEVSISETSELTDEPHEKKHKRASFFGIGSLGNSGPQPQFGPIEQPGQEPQQFNPPEKKKTFFSTGGLAKQMTGKTDHSNTNNDTSSSQGVGAKKRLSELKGMFKGGPKDDPQAAKPELPQSNRPPVHGLPPGAHTGFQGPQSGQPQQFGQDTMMPNVSGARFRSGTQSSAQGPPPMQSPPNVGPVKPQSTGDGKERKASAGGFLGNLFGNRPGSSATESKAYQSTSSVSGQSTVQQDANAAQQFRPSPGGPPGQQSSQRMVYPGQPFFSQGQPGPNIPPQGQPGAPGQHLPPAQQGQRLGINDPQVSHHSSPQLRQQGSTQPNGMSGPTGPMVTVRQPSHAPLPIQVVPLQQSFHEPRPSIAPQQGSHSTLRPEDQEYGRALGSNPVTPAGEMQQALDASSDDFSPRSSQDRLSIGGSSVLPRVSPNRKPVGSGPSRSTSGTVPIAQGESRDPKLVEARPETHMSKNPEHSNEFGGDGQQRYGGIQLSHGGSRLGAPNAFEHTRQPSYPTPSQSPALIPGSSDAQRRFSSHSGQPKDSPLAQQHGFGSPLRSAQQSPDPNRDGASPPMQAPSNQAIGTPQGQLGQFEHSSGQTGQPGPQFSQTSAHPSHAPGPQHMQPPQPWGFTRTGSQPVNASVPQGQQHPPQPGQGTPGPGSAQEQKGTMSKLFAGVANRRDSTSPQPPAIRQQAYVKEKQSTSSKLFGAFKRTKQQDQTQPQQQRPSHGQQMVPPMMQGGRGQVSNHPHQHGQPVPGQMNQAGRGQPVSGLPPDRGSFGPAPGQHQGPSPAAVQTAQFGRGQMPPPQILSDRGQPQSQIRVGHGQISPTVIPMMQPTRSQNTAPRQEPHYGVVPIPRGYEAVHGYGVPNLVAHSPYNISRSSPPQQFGPHFQPIVPHHTGTSQQYQPMMPQNIGASQQIQPIMSQHTGTTQADPRNPSPAPSQQVQSPYSHQQGQSLLQPGAPASATASLHTQQPQLQHLASQQTGNPMPQQPYSIAQPLASHSPSSQHLQHNHVESMGSPEPQSSQDTSLSPSSARNPDQDLNTQSRSEQISMPPSQLPHLQLQHIVTAVDQPSDVQNTRSPQHQPLPDSATTFSPINNAAGRLSDPPLPPIASVQDSRGEEPLHHTSHPPSPPPDVTSVKHPSIRHVPSNFSVVDEPRNGSLSPDVARHRTFSVSPEPSGLRSTPTQQASTSNLSVNVNRANSHTPDHGDMYNATPRSEHASQQQHAIQDAAHQTETPKAGLNGAAVAGGAAAGVAAGALASEHLSRSSSYQVEPSQATVPAQAAPLEPEEKILVDQPVELAAFHDDGNDLPAMSATSYPGQEWNPYGAGEFGDWE